MSRLKLCTNRQSRQICEFKDSLMYLNHKIIRFHLKCYSYLYPNYFNYQTYCEISENGKRSKISMYEVKLTVYKYD